MALVVQLTVIVSWAGRERSALCHVRAIFAGVVMSVDRISGTGMMPRGNASVLIQVPYSIR